MKKRTKIVLCCVLTFAVVAAILVYQMFRNPLTVVQYTIQTDFSESIRMVHLTDLHSWSYGEDNIELVNLVSEQEPDLILMTGDMMDKTDENPDVACSLIRQLKDTAPVYFSYGNHESAWMHRTGIDLRPILTEAGATVLDIEYLDLEIKGQEVRLGGYYNYYRQPHMLTHVQEEIQL